MTSEATPIDCEDAVRHLWDLLDGQVSPHDRRALDDHLAWCLRCCGELAFARELRSMLRRRSDGDLPGDVRERLHGFIDSLGEPTGTGDGR